MKATIKIFSLLLILLLLGAMTVTICAEEANVTATVIATNGPTYSVVVPTEISAADLLRTPETSYYQKDFTISVPEVLFLEGKQIDVTVTTVCLPLRMPTAAPGSPTRCSPRQMRKRLCKAATCLPPLPRLEKPTVLFALTKRILRKPTPTPAHFVSPFR